MHAVAPGPPPHLLRGVPCVKHATPLLHLPLKRSLAADLQTGRQAGRLQTGWLTSDPLLQKET